VDKPLSRDPPRKSAYEEWQMFRKVMKDSVFSGSVILDTQESLPMEKIAFVKLQHDKTEHWIPATEIKQEMGALAIYKEERVVGRFDLLRVEHWALELADDEQQDLSTSIS
jgi:hypothetical protein